MPKIDYEARKQARIERYEKLAQKHKESAERAYNSSRAILNNIPMGQPILVGHHSERKHRRDIARIESIYSKALESQEKEKYYLGKIHGTSFSGISSDDPEAIQRLKEELAEAEAARDQKKDANRRFRKGGESALTETELTDYQSVIRAFGSIYKQPYPPYELQNIGAKIKRLKDRIAELSAELESEVKPDYIGEGFKITENRDENRVMVYFDKIPPVETRTKLKQHGFKWSPTNGAWQRMIKPRVFELAVNLLSGQ